MNQPLSKPLASTGPPQLLVQVLGLSQATPSLRLSAARRTTSSIVLDLTNDGVTISMLTHTIAIKAAVIELSCVEILAKTVALTLLESLAVVVINRLIGVNS